jgi:hypothetical protein
MRRVIIMLTLTGLMAGVPRQAAKADDRVQHETSQLQFVSLADYAFGISGKHWGTFARVTVTLYANRLVERLAVRTTANGAFLIGVSAADLCSTTSIGVYQGARHHMVLRGPHKPCLVILESSPRMTILQGKGLPSHQLLHDPYERQSSKHEGTRYPHRRLWRDPSRDRCQALPDRRRTARAGGWA